MTSPTVAGLYDALLAFESRRRGDGAYPVHKRLRFTEEGYEDIYDWVADRLQLRTTDRVLDVGCGVGFGTIRLAERGVAHATGITVSPGEIAQARRARSQSPRSADIDFREGSFDRLPVAAFDVVVAVESLKHSADLGVTLRAIRTSLAPGGKLVIVEDVFAGEAGCASARRVVEDWRLARLYSEADYLYSLKGARCQVVDLTDAVRSSNGVSLAGKIAALRIALPWLRGPRATAARAFRGGLHLEKLYSARAMHYKAFLWNDAAGSAA